MKKGGGLFSNTVILGASAVLSKAIAFFLLPFYTAHLSPADFGTADLLVDTAILLLPIVSLNAPEAVFRFLAGREQEGKAVVTVSAVLLSTGMTLAFLLLPLVALFPLLRAFAPYLACYVVASISRSYLAHILRGEGRYTAYAVQQVSCAVLTALLQLLLLGRYSLGTGGYLLGVIAADATVALFLLFFVRPWQYFSFSLITRQRLRVMLGYALPLIPTAVLWWVTSISDRYIILHYCGSDVTGLYAAAARIPTALTFAVGVFMEAWQYAAIGIGDARRGEFFSRVYGMLASLCVLGAAAIIALAFPLVSLIYAPEYERAVVLVPLLVVSSLFSALASFLGSVYAVKLKSVASLLTALCSAALNLLLNFYLIPRAGAIGAALATLFSYLVLFAVRLWHTRRYLYFSYRIPECAVSLSFLLVSSYAVIKGAYDLAILPAFLSPLPFWREIGELLGILYKKLSFFRKKHQNDTPPY